MLYGSEGYICHKHKPGSTCYRCYNMFICSVCEMREKRYDQYTIRNMEVCGDCIRIANNTWAFKYKKNKTI